MALLKCGECRSKVSDSAMECPHCGALVGRLRGKRGGRGKFLMYGLLVGFPIVLLGAALYYLPMDGGISSHGVGRLWQSDWEVGREALIRQAEAAALAEDYAEVVRLCDSRDTHGDPILKILREHAVAELDKAENRSVSAHSGSK